MQAQAADHRPLAPVFVCYSRADMEIVDAIVSALAERGHSIWIDRAAIVGSQTWRAKIVEALEECQAVIFFGSRSSYASRHVATELTLAEEARKPIVPVLLDDSRPDGDMQYFLARLHYLKLSGGDSSRVVRDIDCALQNIGNPDGQRPDVIPSLPPPKKSRFLQVAVALILLLSTGFALWHFEQVKKEQAAKEQADRDRADRDRVEKDRVEKERVEKERVARNPPPAVPPLAPPSGDWLDVGRIVEVIEPIRGGVLTKLNGAKLSQRTEFGKGERLKIWNVTDERIQLQHGLAEDAWLKKSDARNYLKALP